MSVASTLPGTEEMSNTYVLNERINRLRLCYLTLFFLCPGISPVLLAMKLVALPSGEVEGNCSMALEKCLKYDSFHHMGRSKMCVNKYIIYAL